MLAHFFMIRDEVNCPLLVLFCFFWGVWGEACGFFLFCLFVAVLTQVMRAYFVRARILRTVHVEIEHQG